MNKTLVIMAAGMGSRYGGLKQIDPVGPTYAEASTKENVRRGSYYGFAARYLRSGRRANTNGPTTASADTTIRLMCPVTLKW